MKLLFIFLFSVNAFAAEKIIGYDKWPDSAEKRVLNLYPGFRDGALSPDWKATPNDRLVLYINNQTAILERAADQVDLHELVNVPDIGRLLDSFATVGEIRESDLTIKQNALFNYRIPPGKAWCASDGLCLNIDFKLDMPTKLAISIALHKPSSLSAQSEVRSFKGAEIDANLAADLKALTGISTPPTALMVQNIFWFNHVMEFGKVLAVVQANPQNPKQSILCGFVVFSIERKWWDNKKYTDYPLSEVFLGRQKHSDYGIRKGLPQIVREVFESLTNMVRH